MKSPAARGRGRPPKPEGALTPAERKRAQRDRDRATLYGTAVIDTMTLDGLLAGVQHALAEGQVATLATVLKELGRRGGLVVTTRCAPGVPAGRASPSGLRGKNVTVTKKF